MPYSPPPKDVLCQTLLSKLRYSLGRLPEDAAAHDWMTAAILTVRDAMVDAWRPPSTAVEKRVYYLSLEFLIGRSLNDSLSNLGIREALREILTEFGQSLDALEAMEPDAALGNGGLGRLAACYMEAMASLGVPAIGYGIRYEHGLFRQAIERGEQVERPEDWLTFRNPWEFERRDRAYEIGFGGTVESHERDRATWTPQERVLAVAYDMPIVGWKGHATTTLRLFRARAREPLFLDRFNRGDLAGAVSDRVHAEAISRVLYPNDNTAAGQELRLRQEYFFTAAALRDVVLRHLRDGDDLTTLHARAAIQLNDTHPALAVAELMRLLVDEHGLGWDEAFDVTRQTIAYTNHTLLPEALETWPVALMERLLPRHMQIIFRINADFLAAALQSSADADLPSLSLIDEHHGRRVRMAHLAFVGAHSVNGVSALHSGLMETTVFAPLALLAPGKIRNVTNGVSPRRWLIGANPDLAALVAEVCGAAALDHATDLSALAAAADDGGLRDRVGAIKRANKERLARRLKADHGIGVGTDWLFDVQIKRIHEYKRQLLNILHTIALYDRLRAEPWRETPPRLKILAGKAASSYDTAKAIIRLANDVARVVNNDPVTRDRLKVAFLPNYNVSLAEAVIPAADLSEQISTAGMEASGTGNMKLALNGALTIGTLDGANIEIAERVGEDAIFIFGLTASQVAERRRDPQRHAASLAPALDDVLEAVAGGAFSPGEPDRYRPLVEALRRDDWFMVAADFAAYDAAQEAVARAYADEGAWAGMAIRNIGSSGYFSADRSIRDYARTIWGLPREFH
jgi:starch phosphorylase